jgi:hypothetical protein
MLRQVTVIILLIAFSAHTLQRTVIVLDYYTNTESFAQRCINKLRPSMNCNGKCLLMKKLKEEEKKDQQAPADHLLFCPQFQKAKRNIYQIIPATFSPAIRIPSSIPHHYVD